jgi:hypothetical protein
MVKVGYVKNAHSQTATLILGRREYIKEDLKKFDEMIYIRIKYIFVPLSFYKTKNIYTSGDKIGFAPILCLYLLIVLIK